MQGTVAGQLQQKFPCRPHDACTAALTLNQAIPQPRISMSQRLPAETDVEQTY